MKKGKKVFSRIPFLRFSKLAFIIILTIMLNFNYFTFMTITADDPENFTFKWQTNYGPYNSWSSPITMDIDGDTIHEIFIAGRYDGGGKCGIFCIDGSDGHINWQDNFTSLGDYHVPIAIDDLDNDGDYELVHAAGSKTIARNCEDGSIFWESDADSGWSTPAIADLDDNNCPYVIVGDNSAFGSTVTLSKLYGTNGTVAAYSNEISYTCYGGVSIADLDRDGEFEIVMSDSGDSHCFDEDLNELWTTSAYTSESHCAVLTNVTGDGDLEVIILNQDMTSPYDGGIYVYDADGNEIPGMYDGTLGLGCHCQPSVYDIDKDGHVEVLTSYGGSTCAVWDLIDWSLDAELEKGAEPPDIANVLGDDDFEVISPEAWVDGQVDIYDSTYANVDTIGGYGGAMYGMNTVTQDIDGDGLNELIISGPGSGNMTIYDTLASAPTPRVRTDTEYYSERRTNVGMYIPKIGGKCIISNINPPDLATGVSQSFNTISVDINEPNGDSIEWWIETSPNIGSSHEEGENNGTKTSSVSGLSFDTTYTVYVNATDGTNWIRETYSFTTESEGETEDDCFYVDGTSGDDSNDGSFSAPWKTIQNAIDEVSAGETIYIMEGIYPDYNTPWSGASSGSENNWITFTNYQNDEVIIDGTGGTSNWAGLFWFDNHHHIRISNLTFRNSSCHGILWENVLGDSSDIIIENCTFYNCSKSAINLKGSSGKIENIIIKDNVISDVQNAWNGQHGDESITLSNCDNFEIKDNFMFNNHKINIDLKSGSSNGEVHDNIINMTSTPVAYGLSGIYIDAQASDCSNIFVYNNILWGNGTGLIAGTEQGGTLTNINFYNNIYNGSLNAFQLNDHTSIPGSHLKTDLRYINNICGEDTNICFQITDAHSSFDNLTIRNNILTGNTGINIASDLDLTDHHVDHNLYYLSGTSEYWGSNSINSSPQFMDSSNGNFLLTNTSPAINAGSSVSSPEKDIRGVQRPQGSGVDIGAYEHIGSSMDLPDISNIDLETSFPLDTAEAFHWANITCRLSHIENIQKVSLNISNPDGSWDDVTMSSIGQDFYYNTTLLLLGYGNYSYSISVYDNLGDSDTSSVILFSKPPNWDVNNDGRCSVMDLVQISNKYWLTGLNGWVSEDIDNNGIINVLDLSIASIHQGTIWYN